MTGKRTYDLAERTATFAEAAIGLAKALPRNAVTLPLIGQMVRSATSVGANICEANDAVSRKDFRNKVGICRKEANETKYWLRMIATAVPESAARARALWKEAHELHLIFAKSFTTAGRPASTAPSPERAS
jgi:four helix bundle protein